MSQAPELSPAATLTTRRRRIRQLLDKIDEARTSTEVAYLYAELEDEIARLKEAERAQQELPLNGH